MNTNPNILLVHGAWADGSCWAKVLLLLKAKGYKAIAPQIPLTSLDDDIAVMRSLLSTLKGPAVVVGHSYGGAVITGAATEPQVKALVYINAFGPDKGESLESLSSQGSPAPGAAAIEADDRGYLWINRDKFHRAFAADVTDDEAYVMAAVQKPLSPASFSGVMGVPAWKRIPSWYLVGADDQMIPPPAQEFMAKRMNATVRSVAASHSAFMSKPLDVADIIALAAESLVQSPELVSK